VVRSNYRFLQFSFLLIDRAVYPISNEWSTEQTTRGTLSIPIVIRADLQLTQKLYFGGETDVFEKFFNGTRFVISGFEEGIF
jgi:hypothetical protein